MASLAQRSRLYAAVAAAELRKTAHVRHKCFLSYHAEDTDEVTEFIDRFSDIFIPKVIGVSDDAPFVDSTDTDYIMECIREKYLSDSTVTIVLVGKCTWSRKFVDW